MHPELSRFPMYSNVIPRIPCTQTTPFGWPKPFSTKSLITCIHLVTVLKAKPVLAPIRIPRLMSDSEPFWANRVIACNSQIQELKMWKCPSRHTRLNLNWFNIFYTMPTLDQCWYKGWWPLGWLYNALSNSLTIATRPYIYSSYIS